MSEIKTYEDLTAWQKAHVFVLGVYKITRNFPREELYGLTSQLRRAAVSIPANIAEGFSRIGLKDKIRFYNIAEASADEARYQLRLAHDLSYAMTSDLQCDASEVKRILRGLILSIQKKAF